MRGGRRRHRSWVVWLCFISFMVLRAAGEQIGGEAGGDDLQVNTDAGAQRVVDDLQGDRFDASEGGDRFSESTDSTQSSESSGTSSTESKEISDRAIDHAQFGDAGEVNRALESNEADVARGSTELSEATQAGKVADDGGVQDGDDFIIVQDGDDFRGADSSAERVNEEDVLDKKEDKRKGIGSMITTLLEEKHLMTTAASKEQMVSSVGQKRERLMHLSKQKRDLEDQVKTRREQFSLKQKNLNSVKDACEQEAEIRKQNREKILSVRSVLPKLTESLETLESEHQQAEEELGISRREYAELGKKFEEMQANLKTLDLEAWLKSTPGLSPMLREALKLTQTTVKPAVNRISKLKRTMSADSGSVWNFMAAVMMYMMVLFPVVVVLAVLLQIQQRFAQVTVRHVVLLGSLYFGLASSICAFGSLMVRGDLLLVVHDRHPTVFDVFIVAQSTGYLGIAICNVMELFRTVITVMGLMQSAAMIAIGLHFSITFAAKFSEEGSNLLAALGAYVIYAFVFLLVAIEKNESMNGSFYRAFMRHSRRRKARNVSSPQLRSQLNGSMHHQVQRA